MLRFESKFPMLALGMSRTIEEVTTLFIYIRRALKQMVRTQIWFYS
jgi:hypothetical protein